MQKPAKFILVIFGASGDLAWRKLIPAMYDLYRQDMLPSQFKILGVGRKKMSNEEFANKMADGLSQFINEQFYDRAEADAFCRQLAYQSIDTANSQDYMILKTRLETLSREIACRFNYLYYFALPPDVYATAAANLYAVGLTSQKEGWKRVILEKPFGHDLESAVRLNRELLYYFKEDQIYRIDHYLGKETVQNIFVVRFSNSVFEPLWNRNYVEYIEITSAETLGVGSRAGYYDTAGALRDMVQNHLLQILGIVAMEPPVNSDATSIRNEMVKVFQSLRAMPEDQVKDFVVRGQYSPSKVKGEHNKGYREEEGIRLDSKTETYLAMKCYIDNWRWSGVPFYIRTGKKMPARVTEAVIHFKPNPHKIFALKNEMDDVSNQLIIRIQPDEGLILKLGIKVPGAGFKVDMIDMDFRYSSLEHNHIPQAYERLLYDCMMGDATLFQRGDAVEITWQFVQPILNAWKKDKTIPVYTYPSGTWGPKESDRLLGDKDFEWRCPCKNVSEGGVYCEL